MQVLYKQLMLLPLFVCLAGEALPSKLDGGVPSAAPTIFQPPENHSSPIHFKSLPSEQGLQDMQNEPVYSAEPNQTEQVKAVILEQLDAIRTQDLSKAYYAYSATDFQQSVPLETFKIYMKQNLAFFRSRNFEIQNIAFSGLLVTVKGVLTDSNQRQTLVEYNFIQENGKWKIRKMVLFAPPS